MTEMRLSRLMALRGLCSRREADEYIQKGLVRVNGKTVTTLGIRVSDDAEISLARSAQHLQSRQITVLLHKPVGYVSGYASGPDREDKRYPSAASLIVEANHYRRDKTRKAPTARQRAQLAPAGRLDIDSHGLLVLTQDGRVARRLIAPDSGVEKEYLVKVRGAISHDVLRRLRHGLSLDGRQLKPARVEQLDENLLRMVLREGRKRQIRRMCEAVSLQVTSLKRTRIGQVRLGGLPHGQWRYLRPGEQF